MGDQVISNEKPTFQSLGKSNTSLFGAIKKHPWDVFRSQDEGMGRFNSGSWAALQWCQHRVFTKQIKQILHQFALCTFPAKCQNTHKLLTINFLRSLALSTEARMSRSQEHSKWDRKVDTKNLIEMLDLPAKLPLNKLSCNYATWTCGHTPCHDANHLTFGLHQTGSWKQPGPRLARDKNERQNKKINKSSENQQNKTCFKNNPTRNLWLPNKTLHSMSADQGLDRRVLGGAGGAFISTNLDHWLQHIP